jgi:DTW domain-containing protein YfiP/RimJ/RimL family protein N-acetyltransferase
LPRQKIALQNVEVLVLQHPNEFRKKTISTVPLLSLILEDVNVAVGRAFDLETRFIREAIDKNYTLAMLYPSEEAIDLDQPTKDEQMILGMIISSEDDKPMMSIDPDRKTLLIACDGTWSQAKLMVQNSPELISKCHQVQFTSNKTTVYNLIRTEPDDHCLSTAEAIAEALIRLEPKNGQEAKRYIHETLDKMVQVQLQYSLNNQQTDPRFTRRKQKVLNKRASRLKLEQSLFHDSDSSFDFGDGTILRPLTQDDVEFVSRVNGNRSVHDISNMIHHHPMYCLGIERSRELIACIVRYHNGELGMLYVDSQHRRKGYASILIQEFVKRMQRIDDSSCVETFIMDGNEASQATFRSLGWKPNDDSKKGTGNRKAKRKWVFTL